ncbi:Hypothetical protein BQ3484_276 [Cedratvirus A11]|uniref:Uncharacterized protein n=1 Tax=Cedratvirus A11 TaxID=1903266 RepID=A0A1M7XUF9_9VIRU|nr:Hypothetical protein BQ3484_276 [Cedratvirus A11]SHO33344.1 Hypothetical protein BQ3484_276 [Cedratvirus A11]
MQPEPISPRSEPVLPKSEILIPILKEMQPKDILRMSLLEPNLFDTCMWKLLSSYSLGADWEYYSYLAQADRKRFAQIAIRKGLLRAGSLRQQVWFAILNQRKDILEGLCTEHASLVKGVCDDLSREDNIYFNRSMVNFAYQRLGYVVSDREKIIANFGSAEKTSLGDMDYIRMHVLNKDDSMYSNWVERGGIVTDDPKGRFVDSFLRESTNRGTWFFAYSITQEKEILEKIFQAVTGEEISFRYRGDILRDLYRANHLDLAKRFETRFAVKLDPELVLSCLADYYFNTGDERGLYQSLLSLGALHKRDYKRSKMSNIELEEITALFK